MKKNLKRLFILVLSVMTTIFTTNVVNAETVANTFIASYTRNTNMAINYAPEGAYNHIKSDGKYVYCIYYQKYVPINIGYTKGELVTDNGLNYILNKAYNTNNDSENFIYSSAIWVYLFDKGMMPDPTGLIVQYSNSLKGDNSTTANQIKQLVSDAKKASANDTAAPTININSSSASFALDSKEEYYVSNNITVTSSTSNYEVILTSAPEGTTITKSGNNIVIKVPASKVTASEVSVSFKVSNSKEIYTSYKYNPSNSAYQELARTFKETKTAENTATVKLSKKVGGVSISKQDITNKEELPGATLVIKDYDGNEIEKWVSTDQPHIINELKPGIYTLTEIIAPDGYVLSTETITFTVKDDGSITKVVMYNSPETKDVPKETPTEVPVENTASFKTITSSLFGSIIVLAGSYIIFKNSKKKEN